VNKNLREQQVAGFEPSITVLSNFDQFYGKKFAIFYKTQWTMDSFFCIKTVFQVKNPNIFSSIF
jgi:hypothetical protein